MFTEIKSDSISSIGEAKLIAEIQNLLGDVSPPSPEGIGDDCAVIQAFGGKHIVTSDSLTYGQHFDNNITAKDAGAKLIKRNLSDIAAMGGYPNHGLLTLLCGNNLRLEWLFDFIKGIQENCEYYEVRLVGGDISSIPTGQFSSVLSLYGYLKHEPLLRSGSASGDPIYVTGSLGGSSVSKHYDFLPRLDEGRWLAEYGACSALIDITDGIAKDLRELVPPQCAAYLSLESIPISEAAQENAIRSDYLPIEHAFCDGEDYELLFTIKKGFDVRIFEEAWAARFPETTLSRIGHMGSSKSGAPYIDATTGKDITWTKGFEHFS
ncbi:MAG: thiamine-phosphate kinase [Verrucomicrobiota bacterium]|nr:thiamine-phosphate kinase [Verrucomicrobiota bacterium]